MYIKKTFNTALAVIQKRRTNAIRSYEMRFDTVYKRFPEIARLNEGLRHFSLKIIKSPNDFEKLKSENIKIQKRIEEILLQAGYPKDYLKIKFHCPYCSDTGYSGIKMCNCLKSEIAKASAEEINKFSNLSLQSFNTFNLEFYKNHQDPDFPNKNFFEINSEIFSTLKKYAYEFTLNSKSILLYGKTGVGKTHLSLSVADVVIKKGYSVIYDSVSNYLRHIEFEKFHYKEDSENTFENLLTADLVIFDDLGAEYNNSYNVALINNIIDTRLNKNKPMIVNTNLNSEELEKRYEQRFVSRLYYSFSRVQISGPDIRQIKSSTA
ncbi:MAG: ATP-binding protein [Ruminococcus sp.]|jgi:DNA replication protein DnaC|nr:ATP-binding protein [Ruminococcus sp.]